MKQNTFPLARQRDIVVQQTNEDLLVYDLKNHKVFCLNETSAAIWQLCDGKSSIADIARKSQIQLKHQIPVELIEMALEKLSKNNLLENFQPETLPSNKPSRREAIRKIGLSTVIALPVITSLVAPNAVEAQSSCVSPLTISCTVGVGACLRTGTQTNPCVAGVFTGFGPCSAGPGIPGPEIPGNGIDDNCNGLVDE